MGRSGALCAIFSFGGLNIPEGSSKTPYEALRAL